MNHSIIAKVLRFEPGRDAEPRFEEFVIATGEPLSVMAILTKVHAIAPSFACRASTCFKGRCGSCLVRVNGKDVFGCITLVNPGEAITVEPHSGFKPIRDVVVDFSQPC